MNKIDVREKTKVRLSNEFYQKIKAAARAGLPNEICGYLSAARTAFQTNSFAPLIEVSGVHPLRNVDESPEHFSFDPTEQFEVFRQVSTMGKRLIGTYHSHPETPSRMSEEDVRLAQDAKMIYGIYSVEDGVLNFFRVMKDSQGKKRVFKLITEIGEEK